MVVKMPLVIDRGIIAEIDRIGKLRLPNEACGVITPTAYQGQRVWEMPNRSKRPQETFQFTSDDLVLALEHWTQEHASLAVWENLTVWHTHPGGQVGPSKMDLENRIEECGNLVVSLGEKGPQATWF